jgi:hypothetical protein
MMDFWLEQHDLQVKDGDFALCPTDMQAIAQTIVIRLKTIQCEWFMDAGLGVPYLTEIFGHKRNERFIKQLILSELQSIHGVREITSFTTTELPDRRLAISFDAILADGSSQRFDESVGF